ncbi:MAG: 7-carboxy-7-deazaguanine synthase QueE [Bacteroidetes bacterium]|nr:7-carboxy-7-deazaguanine synthase QueE [Rhodothermia bacterium]MCS7155549.1 7-carboxy-7-deazaguanine synthase QueE [Bacteroidota bacterium]MCX7906407.1 7-carboxy-7-deazaguanine synthase QueE [Bacteroidota bacterium]MDW8137311.1 7-carboxy-7-deazaguanine synthase QueE [Bacteroidota bacterium]MDW8284819.1 7-carboxy-7-deazaguanine synthase QueE [Bacteroidota bacterium]
MRSLEAPDLLEPALALEVRYSVVEHFYSLQGEGAWTGHAAYFIRLAGCDVGCWWCDTKASWDASAHPTASVSELVEAAQRAPTPIVVLTGGEPLMHDLGPLTRALRASGKRVHLETSGAYPLSGHVDWLTLSPKKRKPPVPEIYPHVRELKVVVVNASDFRWAEAHAARCPEGTLLFLQPEWGSPHMIEPILRYIQAHPRWRLSLQVHKYLNIP